VKLSAAQRSINQESPPLSTAMSGSKRLAILPVEAHGELVCVEIALAMLTELESNEAM
jgi:hypothetical protein